MLLTERQVRNLWAKIDQSAGLDECWPWRACLRGDGYGWVGMKIDDRKRTFKAHRVVAHLTLGLDLNDPDQLACHHCDNPPCCNPLHLFVGSHRDNTMDGVTKGRIVAPHYSTRWPNSDS